MRNFFLWAIFILIGLSTVLGTPTILNFLKESKKNSFFSKSLKTNYNFFQNGVYGIDVSHHQKQIDWKKVSQHENPKIEFVYMKASEGVTHKDSRFKYNYKNAKSNGLRVGVYHFFSPTTLAKDQFREFKKTYPKDGSDLPVLVDCEQMGESTDKYFRELYIFLDLCEKYYKKKPIIYSTQRFYNTYLKYKVQDYQLMIGRYNNKKNQPELLDNQNWTIWQFTEKGKVSGITKEVDINIAKNQFWNP